MILAASGPLWGLLVVIYIVLLIVLGVTSLRKGHWIMFIIGIFIPLFWIIGAVLPPVERD
jgi:ATP/ADP translocase